MRKSAFFAIILATLGIAHAPAFGDEECEIQVNQYITGSFGPNIISITGFKTGEHTLSDDCTRRFKAELDKVLTPDTISVSIAGHASEVGNAEINSKLSKKRAETVEAIIQKYTNYNVQVYIIIAGESTSNVYPMNSSNAPQHRSVDVIFSYPQLTPKYQDIIFLKNWKEKHLPSNPKCNADELFTRYIEYLRKNSTDENFHQANIDTAMENCKVAAGNTDEAREITNYTEIRGIYGELTTIHKKFSGNISVWKNADGKFNTARLASDSIAGVVLGTAGGLITSNVVKKNQIENGFEDIKCTIGGQNVAAWGDQFRVGIQ